MKILFSSMAAEKGGQQKSKLIKVDHFIMKKETICHISVIWDTEVMKHFTQSVMHIRNTITRFSWLS